MPNKSPKIKK